MRPLQTSSIILPGKWFSLERQTGRIYLVASIYKIGPDLLVFLGGGRVHIGTIALATAAQDQIIAFEGHKDDIPARIMANIVAKGLNCHVATLAGIHYEDITQAEIETVLLLTEQMAYKIVKMIKMGDKMLNIPEVEDFIAYMRSGQLEERFKCSGEIERGEILELLEKVMDAADLADEVATRLIFRGGNLN